MVRTSPQREFSLLVKDVARMVRTCADAAAQPYGLTWAQWAVLARLERQEGIKQAELAESLDIQPITLTRLIDRLCERGMIERRADPNDRRAKRLFLTPAARPLLDRLWTLGSDLLAEVLAGVEESELTRMIAHLTTIRQNLRSMIEQKTIADREEQLTYARP